MSALKQPEAVMARRGDGYQRAIAVRRPGMGATGAPRFEVCALPAPVHVETGAPRGALVDEPTAMRVGRAFVAYKAARSQAGEWTAASVVVVE